MENERVEMMWRISEEDIDLRLAKHCVFLLCIETHEPDIRK